MIKKYPKVLAIGDPLLTDLFKSLNFHRNFKCITCDSLLTSDKSVIANPVRIKAWVENLIRRNTRRGRRSKGREILLQKPLDVQPEIPI